MAGVYPVSSTYPSLCPAPTALPLCLLSHSTGKSQPLAAQSGLMVDAKAVPQDSTGLQAQVATRALTLGPRWLDLNSRFVIY